MRDSDESYFWGITILYLLLFFFYLGKKANDFIKKNQKQWVHPTQSIQEEPEKGKINKPTPFLFRNNQNYQGN